jgi:hypothetical protein
VESAKIVLLCFFSAIIFGILHDYVTARVCVEYFTIGHPPIFDTGSPTLLAFGWGTIATWWVGLILGILAACVSRLGSWPKFTAKQLVHPILLLLAVVTCAALMAGVIGFFLAGAGWVWLVEPLASRIPASKRQPFVADLWAHSACYAAVFLGGIVVSGWLLLRRWRTKHEAKLDL